MALGALGVLALSGTCAAPAMAPAPTEPALPEVKPPPVARASDFEVWVPPREPSRSPAVCAIEGPGRRATAFVWRGLRIDASARPVAFSSTYTTLQRAARVECGWVFQGRDHLLATSTSFTGSLTAMGVGGWLAELDGAVVVQRGDGRVVRLDGCSETLVQGLEDHRVRELEVSPDRTRALVFASGDVRLESTDGGRTFRPRGPVRAEDRERALRWHELARRARSACEPPQGDVWMSVRERVAPWFVERPLGGGEPSRAAHASAAGFGVRVSILGSPGIYGPRRLEATRDRGVSWVPLDRTVVGSGVTCLEHSCFVGRSLVRLREVDEPPPVARQDLPGPAPVRSIARRRLRCSVDRTDTVPRVPHRWFANVMHETDGRRVVELPSGERRPLEGLRVSRVLAFRDGTVGHTRDDSEDCEVRVVDLLLRPSGRPEEIDAWEDSGYVEDASGAGQWASPAGWDVERRIYMIEADGDRRVVTVGAEADEPCDAIDLDALAFFARPSVDIRDDPTLEDGDYLARYQQRAEGGFCLSHVLATDPQQRLHAIESGGHGRLRGTVWEGDDTHPVACRLVDPPARER